MDKKKTSVNMLEGSIFKSLVIFMIPILISNIFQQFYNTMDTAIVGNTLGMTSLSAIGSCAAVYDLLVGFALGIGNGLSIVTARSYGSGDEELLKKSVAASFVIGIISSVVMCFGTNSSYLSFIVCTRFSSVVFSIIFFNTS